MRWRQVWNEETGKSDFIPITDGAVQPRAAIHGDIESFKSPIDGQVISDRKQYREHCKQHNVVPSAEFTPEFYERKAKQRARLFTGERTRAESLQRKQEIYETMTRLERNER